MAEATKTAKKRTTKKRAAPPESIEAAPNQTPEAPPPASPPTPTPTFFETVARVSKEDWGARCLLYLYRLEPIIDRLRGSDKKYVCRYAEPVDEEGIKQQHGSGRYRLVLTFRKPAADKSNTIDHYEFDILDRAYPPKIPAGEWVDDPRNNKWLWAKDLVDGKQVQQSPMQSLNDALDVVERLKSDAPPAAAVRTAAQELMDTATAMKTLGIVGQPPTEDKSAGLMMELFKTQLTILQGQLEAARQREHETMLSMIKEAKESRKENGDGIGSTLKTLLQESDNITTLVQKFWPAAKDAVAGTHRKNVMDVIIEAAPIVGDVLKPFAAAAAQIILHKATQPSQQQPHQNGQPQHAQITAGAQQQQPNGVQTQGQQDVRAFVANTVVPAMLNKLPLDAPGEELGGEFAEWMEDGYGNDRLSQVQAAGADWTIQYFRTSPLWPAIVALCTEEKFNVFIKAFMEWKPEADNENEGEALTPEVVEV